MDSAGVVPAMLLAVIARTCLARMLPFGVPLPLLQMAPGAAIAAVFHHGVLLAPDIFSLRFLPLLFLDGWRIPRPGCRAAAVRLRALPNSAAAQVA